MRQRQLILVLLLLLFSFSTTTTTAQWAPRPCKTPPLNNLTTRLSLQPASVLLASPGRCDDYSAVCADSEQNLYLACWFLGEGDCKCKGMRQYNKCMEEVDCPGYGEAFMIQQNCENQQPIIP